MFNIQNLLCYLGFHNWPLIGVKFDDSLDRKLICKNPDCKVWKIKKDRGREWLF